MAVQLTPGRRNLLLVAAALAVAGGFYLKSIYDERWMPPGPPEVAGRILMERKSCFRCHRIDGKGGEVGPDLTGVALRKLPDWMDEFLRNPRALRPQGRMPRPKLTDEQRRAVVAYLTTLRGPSEP